MPRREGPVAVPSTASVRKAHDAVTAKWKEKTKMTETVVWKDALEVSVTVGVDTHLDEHVAVALSTTWGVAWMLWWCP